MEPGYAESADDTTKRQGMMLTQLGQKVETAESPEKSTIECVPVEMAELRNAVARYSCPEFTSLCLAGDTLVDVCCNETEYPKGIPIQQLVGTEGYVFSFDPSMRQPVVKKYFDVRKTQENVPVVKVEMLALRGTNTMGRKSETVTIRLTPDHLVLVIRGWNGYEWVPAGKLKIGDRIFSDQRGRGDTIRCHSRHSLIAQCLIGRKLRSDEDAHHINTNHFDNTPINIEVLADGEHSRLHRSMQYGYDDIIDVNKLVKLYESNPEISIIDIAQEYRCDPSTIESRLKGRTRIKSQAEILLARRSRELENAMEECSDLYQEGYTTREISMYFEVHDTTILQWLRKKGIQLRESNRSRALRKSLDLPSLNHKVISVTSDGTSDVYNMEVEDTECFFANEIVVHNCPVTGQPDYAKLYIDVIPNMWLPESKSLKLFLGAFRQHGGFHEETTVYIGTRLHDACHPTWIRIAGLWFPRGGIGIDCFWEKGHKGTTYVPTLRQRNYEGR